MLRLVAFSLSAALLAACQQADTQAANDTDAAAANAPAAAEPAVNAAAPLGAAVDADRAKVLMHERHEGMESIGDATKILSRELKGDGPDLDQVRKQAAIIARVAPQVPGWFPPGTGPDVGKTHAKAEIWQKPEDFAAKATAFNRAATAFNTAAQGSDVAAIKASFGELGKSCKACHDLYRAKKD